MFYVDCEKCPLQGCCNRYDGKFNDVNNCPLAHTVWTQVKDWNKFQWSKDAKSN